VVRGWRHHADIARRVWSLLLRLKSGVLPAAFEDMPRGIVPYHCAGTVACEAMLRQSVHCGAVRKWAARQKTLPREGSASPFGSESVAGSYMSLTLILTLATRKTWMVQQLRALPAPWHLEGGRLARQTMSRAVAVGRAIAMSPNRHPNPNDRAVHRHAEVAILVPKILLPRRLKLHNRRTGSSRASGAQLGIERDMKSTTS